ncbi:MAG: FAD-binding oxidoreductase [Caldilineaceae bacterium]
MTQTCDVLICGAGIAGIAAAYHLVVKQGVKNVVLVDERPPLSLTSDKSTEAYRNWWPGPDDAMVRYMNRSIDLIEQVAEETQNRILLNRRGYVYATKNPAKIAEYEATARLAEQQGAGEVRIYRGTVEDPVYQPTQHTGYRNQPPGADLILDPALIRREFPYLSSDIVAVLHARRCGWFSGQQLGMVLLEAARAQGATLVSGRVAQVELHHNRVVAVHVAAADGTNRRIETGTFVNAAGPFAKQVGQLLGLNLPIFSELHLKAAFDDRRAVIGRNAGLTILDDPISLEWEEEERAELAANPQSHWLTQPFPAGIHFRPEGYHESQGVLMLWDYHSSHRYDVPILPLPEDELYPEIVMRGMSQLVPGLKAYWQRLPKFYVDGGYYTKTEENRPLIGPLPIEGAFICAAFSGFGLMAAMAGGELLAAHVTGATLPDYVPKFALSRYDDPAYRQMLARWGSTGQL